MNGVPEELKLALAASYEIERPIGQGGMATVYLARDIKHRRNVAVKIMRPDLAASLGTDRFLKEIEIAAQLTHAHIVPLYDSGEAGGLLYYVMPYVNGESLRGLLNRENQPEVPFTVSVAEQVADALDYAHRMGVLHRDIKPENILLSEGHAFVTDFGIAKAVSTAGGETITRTGFGLGTPGYMSPEQAAGVRNIDQRTDVYGLACVIYEMMVGDTPGLWPTEEATRVGRFLDATAEHRERLDELPGRVEQVLSKALAMRPPDRFASPVEFVDALAAACDSSRARYSDIRAHEIINLAVELQAARATVTDGLPTRVLEEVAVEVGIPPERVHQVLEELGRPTSYQVGNYSDAEIRKIFQRAVELEERHSIEQGKLSIGGIEQIGAQVGLSPEQVGRAVDELDSPVAVPADAAVPLKPAEAARAPALGGEFRRSPVKLVVDRTVAGEEAVALYATMVDEIQRVIGTPGQATTLGRTLSWSTMGLGSVVRYIQVTVSPEAGQTEINIEEQVEVYGRRLLGGLAGGGIGALIGLTLGLGLGAADTGLPVLFSSVLAMGGAVATMRSVLVTATRQRKEQLEHLADRLAAIAAGKSVD
ncbi:MAG: serine/threonine protein kinase [Gemmatimonadota bacterium]|nr:MAG: serine/threonine protein kinase [Gemmatimonadota bacterium]